MGVFDYIKAFGLIIVISVAFIYGLQSRLAEPIILPGDVYVRKGTKGLYIPVGSALILSTLIFLIFLKLSS